MGRLSLLELIRAQPKLAVLTQAYCWPQHRPEREAKLNKLNRARYFRIIKVSNITASILLNST